MRALFKQTSHTSAKTTTPQETADWYMEQAQKAFMLTKEEILEKKKPSPEKISIGMILKENTGMPHREIAEYLQMGHHVRSSF